jgi:hypothetical protein
MVQNNILDQLYIRTSSLVLNNSNADFVPYNTGQGQTNFIKDENGDLIYFFEVNQVFYKDRITFGAFIMQELSNNPKVVDRSGVLNGYNGDIQNQLTKMPGWLFGSGITNQSWNNGKFYDLPKAYPEYPDKGELFPYFQIKKSETSGDRNFYNHQ